MKYRDEEGFDEVLRRGQEIKKKHDQRVKHVLTATSAVLAVALLGVLGIFTGVGTATDTIYGSFILPAEAGGYILTAVIAFALGIVVAMTVRYYRNRTGAEDQTEKVD